MTASASTPPSASLPLQPAKRLPRPHASTPTAKRARSTEEPMTPHPSSDMDVDHLAASTAFKLPSIPLRVSNGPMTPSTSTVAFSSSPKRMMSSSPSRASHFHPYPTSTSRIDHDLTLQHGMTLVFGRHRHNAEQRTSTTLASSVPRHLAHLLASPSNAATTIHLSRDASHASRVHAVIELLEPVDKETLRIIVVGQNGLRVRVPGRKKAVRLLQGQRFDTPVTQDGVEVDFFGSRAVLRTEAKIVEAEEETPRRERLFSFSPATPEPRFESSLPPSSPPLSAADIATAEHEDDIEGADGEQDNQPRIDSRASSPLSPPVESVELSTEELFAKLASVEPAAAETDEKKVKAEQIEQSAPVKSASRAPSPVVAAPNKPLPADIDLPAIIASTVVFSGSSKLSLPDLVKHMLESQPSLKEHGDEAQWSVWVSDALESNAMFGKVQRHGKDSSGHPLLPHYFYNPAADLDASRAKELGGLVRPLRAAQRAGGKAIDWRPVGRGRRTHG